MFLITDMFIFSTGASNFNVSARIRTHYFDSRFLYFFTLPVFRIKQGAWHKWIQLMKGFHFPSTRTTNSVRLILGTQYSLCENYIKRARLHWGLKQVLGTNLIPLRTKFDTQTKRVPAWPVINQLCFPERHFSANGISLRLSEVQMKFYERSLQALLSSAPRGLAARSRIFVRLASLAQIGELARILCCLKRVKKKIKAICTVLISCTVWNFGYELKYYRWTSVKQVSRLPSGWCRDGGRGHDFQKIANLSALTGKKQNI